MTDTFNTLLAQLTALDVKQRSQAVLQLQPDQASHLNADDAIAALVHLLCTDDDLNIVEDATWVLVRYGTAAIPALLAEISHADARARHNIVHALGKIGNAQAVPALIIATRDSDRAVRLKSVYALGQIGDPQAIDALITRLDDAEKEVQWTAHEVLQGFGETALPHLIEAMRMESAQVRELVTNLLGEIGDKRAVDPLLAALETEDWQVRFAIVEALGAIGDSRALPMIEQMTHDTQPPVRAIATRVMKLLDRRKK